MITRNAPSCLRQSVKLAYTRCLPRKSISQRRWSTSSSYPPQGASPTPQSVASPIASITTELDKLSPRIDVSADSIEILRSPAQFYETLKTKILNANDRIYLSTLYVGKAEHELIDTIHAALQKNRSLKVSILTDALRGTREAPDGQSCASLLASLIKSFPEQVDIRMYHTPNLVGLKKRYLPKRVNEGWGLQHMKLYGFDDEIILSGANLSDDYFTNRQDRYHLFKSKEVTDFFAKVYECVAALSYRVLPSDDQINGGFIFDWPESNIQPAPLDNAKAYIEAATQSLVPLTESVAPTKAIDSRSDTHVYPLLQLTPLLRPDTSTELPALTRILEKLASPAFEGSRWTFTAGYFNMTPQVRDLLLHARHSEGAVVAASPWANGFYGSKGVSGMLPSAYTYLARSFLKAVQQVGLDDRIVVKEWRKGTVNEPEGWTYHAKGVWLTLPREQNPSVSLIGSSNYTKRSYSLDLEANAMIVTNNTDLQRRLGEEEKWLQEHAKQMTRDDYATNERRVGLHVRIAMWIVTLVGGAL
ncbi:hypothetical protein K431DRAFT_287733 [Polychaeton citri CBS 116435]|uniref:CDP-diacylglycerol--glycerol-3-phosphate 3-phosphatidyltransferase n=1 Tax=Polychaeton citri CBS 116435 TaxID=1314669 RepID=A0A9P4Q557_9PEZI|nr:hypothetical protein K431DRAFT_287733 [Polychaeton citri CBS 116435]